MRDDFDDLPRRIASMDAARVDVQLFSPWIDLSAYSLPVDDGVRYSRMFNDHLAETVASHPDRFLGLCTAPLQSPTDAAEELRRAVVDLGMAGVEIATTVDGRELDEPDLDPFWGMAQDLRCPVLIHPYRSLAGRGVSRHFLGNLVGNPAESTIAIAHLIFGGVLDRFPDLRFVLVHGGGFAPWQSGRWEHGYTDAPRMTHGRIGSSPRALLERVHYDTVLHDPLLIEFLVRWAGAERVVLGSDYPFPMGDLTPVDSIEATTLSADVRHAILGGNVARLLADIQR